MALLPFEQFKKKFLEYAQHKRELKQDRVKNKDLLDKIELPTDEEVDDVGKELKDEDNEKEDDN